MFSEKSTLLWHQDFQQSTIQSGATEGSIKKDT
jgi:hypothetical protein